MVASHYKGQRLPFYQVEHVRREMLPITDEVRVDFFARVNPNGPVMPHMDTRCHVYGSGTVHGHRGYRFPRPGQTGETFPAHRVAAAIAGETLDLTGVVRHLCDNRECVNPEHIEPSTKSQNSIDFYTRGKSTADEVMRLWRAEQVANVTDEDRQVLAGIADQYERRRSGPDRLTFPACAVPVDSMAGHAASIARLRAAMLLGSVYRHGLHAVYPNAKRADQ